MYLVGVYLVGVDDAKGRHAHDAAAVWHPAPARKWFCRVGFETANQRPERRSGGGHWPV